MANPQVYPPGTGEMFWFAEDPDRVHRSGLEVAATWLATGLDTENAVFYRQSDIPEIPELTWMPKLRLPM